MGIVTNKPVERVEIKASELLKPSVLTRFGGVSAPHYRLVSEILASVSDCRGTCFGVLVNPIEPRLVKDCSRGCPEIYQHLIKMVGRWMEEAYPSQPVTLALDTEENGVNLPLSRAIADYLYRSASGKRMKHVFPSPFWIDSQSMAGAQVADLVAHILMNSMLPQGERKQLSSLWQQVNSLRWAWENGSGGTIRRVKFMADGGETPADAD